MGFEDTVEIPRKTMVLFFMVDTSGSMGGEKIGAVNTAIEEVIPALKEVSDDNPDAIIKVAAMQFSMGAEWITKDGPVEADKFRWNYLDASGQTDLGEACRMLNEKLSRNAFMQSASGSLAPVIFLISDGAPTDDFQAGLAALKKNRWFEVAGRVALAIGTDEEGEKVLIQFTGTAENVLKVHDRATLKKMIKLVAVRSSQIGSKSTKVGDQASTGEGLDLTPVIKSIAEDEAFTTGKSAPSAPPPGEPFDFTPPPGNEPDFP